ncbi:hypothetical protein PIB30_060284 [Stylosanthes scabra]|uniref:Uncharacterized protein n=1 Tax=Stylosanthes scabra TaxID=79078 RepID=A0ABU6UJ99_9FABA|nr:hypothetical protein [Stylosanthes scabra]
MDGAQTTLHDHRAPKDQSIVPSRQSNMAPKTQCAISVDRLLGPPHVSTKGRPTKRRLGAELDKAIKNSTRRKNKKKTEDRMKWKLKNEGMPKIIGSF